jgi:hypothetical protein
MVRQHEFNTEIARRSNHVEIGAASGDAENAIYPELAESLCEVLRQALQSRLEEPSNLLQEHLQWALAQGA